MILVTIQKNHDDLENAIKNKDSSRIRECLQREYAEAFLLSQDEGGFLPMHHACSNKLDSATLQLILDAAVEHGIIKQMLEAKDKLHDCTSVEHGITDAMFVRDAGGSGNCVHMACENELSTDSLRVVLEYISKYSDIEKIFESGNYVNRTCLHVACKNNASADNVRLLISFFPSKEMCKRVIDAKDYGKTTAVGYANDAEVKQLLRDGKCFEKCRLWLFSEYQDTFLHSLFANSFDKTCQALLELNNGLQQAKQYAAIILMALMSSPSKFRDAINKTTTSAPMSSYFDVVKNGDKKSDYNHWRKNIHLFREFYGQWPPSERKTASKCEGSSSCVIQ